MKKALFFLALCFILLQVDAPAMFAPYLPSMVGQSGKFLTNNGSAASWGTVGGGSLPTTTVTDTSDTFTFGGTAVNVGVASSSAFTQGQTVISVVSAHGSLSSRPFLITAIPDSTHLTLSLGFIAPTGATTSIYSGASLVLGGFGQETFSNNTGPYVVPARDDVTNNGTQGSGSGGVLLGSAALYVGAGVPTLITSQTTAVYIRTNGAPLSTVYVTNDSGTTWTAID